MKKEIVIYVHGKGGTYSEAEKYKTFFPESDVYGFDYKSQNPWDAKKEFKEKINDYAKNYSDVILIAQSIGAYFSMISGIDNIVTKSFFISPIVDMEKLILSMMSQANVTEKDLKIKKIIPIDFGDDLSWEYLSFVRKNKIQWNVSTEILYGSADNLQNRETILDFVKNTGAGLTIMENGEHWFHTKEQIKFLDDWLNKFC